MRHSFKISTHREDLRLFIFNSAGPAELKGCCGGVAASRRARVIARRRATRDSRATLSRGETRRSEKLASRDATRARTRRDRATDAHENVNRASRIPETVRGVARVFSARDARRAVRAGCCAGEVVDLKSSRRVTRSARARGGTARRTRAKTSIAHRASRRRIEDAREDEFARGRAGRLGVGRGESGDA